MNIINILQAAFPNVDESISVEDKYSTFSIEYNIKQSLIVDVKHLDEIHEFIPYDDSFTLEIVIEEDDPIVITSSNFNKESFTNQISEGSQYLEEGENVKVKLLITKDTSNSIIHIYSFKDYLNFCDKLSVMEWLDMVAFDLSVNKYLKFKVLVHHFVNTRTPFEKGIKLILQDNPISKGGYELTKWCTRR